MKKRYVLIGLLVILLAIAAGVAAFTHYFLSAETSIRDSWEVETGDLLMSDEEYGVSAYEADVESDINVISLLPDEIEDEGFTYYEETVQQRIAAALVQAGENGSFTLESPLAVLNPFGTGSNGLYLYFTTDWASQIRYTIHVDDESIPDYTAVANNGDREFSRMHEFLMIGLVPGETNHVTLEVLGKYGRVQNTAEFTITMPEPQSGYATKLEYTDGEAAGGQTEGLFYTIRTGGYTGYAFFYDNSGIMRYEMVLEGYGLDRMLWYEGEMLTCASAYKIARFNRLGQVTQTYALDGYEMHHDMVFSGDNSLVVLASEYESTDVEDLLLEVDLVTGEVTELIDFKDVLPEYYENYAHVIGLDDEFKWLAGKKDWIHLNTVQYMEEDDSVIVSSRETSTIIKVRDIHGSKELDYLIGDENFWKDTPYESYSYTKVGDFTPQYGQHTVEYAGNEGLEEGQYYLRLFDNNYWSLSTRDSYEPDLPDSVGTALLDDSKYSHVYFYLVDENARTYELVDSFDVPYSSIVSNVTPVGDNYVVNSGCSMVFGEYTQDGTLIREYSYECTLQTDRVMKGDFIGFWFAE